MINSFIQLVSPVCLLTCCATVPGAIPLAEPTDNLCRQDNMCWFTVRWVSLHLRTSVLVKLVDHVVFG